MKLHRIISSIFIISITSMMLMVNCAEKPTAPEQDNPLHSVNPGTAGDPFHLTISIADGGVRLAWNRVNVSSVTGYNIYRSTNDITGYIKLDEVAADRMTYTDKTIENGHTYWYKITAFGNSGQESSQTNVESVWIHTDPVIIINGGDEFTASREVSVTVLAADAKQFLLSNDPDFTTGDWETFESNKNWNLATGEGTKVVYLKVKYYDDTESNILSDSIEPLPMEPSILIAGDSVYAKSRDVELNLSAAGANLQVKLCTDASFSGISWIPFEDTRNFTLPTGKDTIIIYAKFKNNFEIESEVVSDDILSQPVTNMSIRINNDAQYTNQREVVLTVNADNATHMKVSEDIDFSAAEWNAYHAVENYTLFTGDGMKTVYMKFMNEFEVETDAVFDEIILDTTPPDANSGIMNETIFQFDASVSSDNYEIEQYRWDWEGDGTFDTNWSADASITHQYDSGGGIKIVRVELMDAAGNIGDATKQIYVNSPPVASFTVSPEQGNLTQVFSFDASGCSDTEDNDNTLQIRWDWDGNGIYNTAYSSEKIATYQYSEAGLKTIILEVRDSDGLSDTTSYQINVADD